MSVRKSLFGLVPVVFLGLAPTAADAAVYCNAAGYPVGCVVRAPRVVVTPAPAPVVVAPAPVVVAPRAYVAPRYVAPRYAPRSAVNLGGPVNRVGVR